MKNLLLMAPPAGGKGTISEMLEKNYGYIHISTGDLIREINPDTALGKEITECIKKGDFVDDKLVLSLLKNELDKYKGKPFILDGFPRNMTQVEEITEFFEKYDIKLDYVIYIDVDYDTCLKRALGRIMCPNCHSSFNKYFKKPKLDDVCDNCGTKLEKRVDDNEESFKSRYEVFHNLTLPVLKHYEKMGILIRTDKDNVYEKIVSVIEND